MCKYERILKNDYDMEKTRRIQGYWRLAAPYNSVYTVHKTGDFIKVYNIDYSFWYHVGRYNFFVDMKQKIDKYRQFRVIVK